ncbi:MAG: hypothetical protein PHE59_02130 [Patescibacteria group bacterium]|nr:hypothetical protein [Patescibacteria group bacterium]MDD5164747.1 hypothetical protein [Patescibacteria group bacterium]MDD5534580.1 hypothetical protein [Patescibacteria group bacterium]
MSKKYNNRLLKALEELGYRDRKIIYNSGEIRTTIPLKTGKNNFNLKATFVVNPRKVYVDFKYKIKSLSEKINEEILKERFEKINNPDKSRSPIFKIKDKQTLVMGLTPKSNSLTIVAIITSEHIMSQEFIREGLRSTIGSITQSWPLR